VRKIDQEPFLRKTLGSSADARVLLAHLEGSYAFIKEVSCAELPTLGHCCRKSASFCSANGCNVGRVIGANRRQFRQCGQSRFPDPFRYWWRGIKGGVARLMAFALPDVQKTLN